MARKKRLPEVLRINQIKKIFNAIDDPRHFMVFATIFFCGLRKGEAAKLKVEDVDLDMRCINIRDAKNPHRARDGYGKDRIVPIPSSLKELMLLWKEYKEESEWFFPARDFPDRHINVQTISKVFMTVLKHLGLKQQGAIARNGKILHKYTVHTLRHAYATYLVEQGVGIEKVGSILGHSDVYKTTMIYTHLSVDSKLRAVDSVFSTNQIERQARREVLRTPNIEGERDTLNNNYEIAKLKEENKTRELRLKELELRKDLGLVPKVELREE